MSDTNKVVPKWAIGSLITIAMAGLTAIIWIVSTISHIQGDISGNRQKILSENKIIEERHTAAMKHVDQMLTGMDRQYNERVSTIERRLVPIEDSINAVEKSMIEIQSDIRFIREKLETKEASNGKNI